MVYLTNKSSSLTDDLAALVLDALSPGSSAERAKGRNEHENKYENPYRIVSDLRRQWIGEITLPNNKVPVRIDLAEDGKVFVVIDNRIKIEITKAVFSTFKIFKGSLSGYIPFSESGPYGRMIRVKLAVRNGRLFGSIAGIFNQNNDHYYIPTYITLKKSKTRGKKITGVF